ncbi:MAG TPA: CYTH domain-containing protein [Gammaproteobacteria bacterium]|jgi:adenylate cyclase|nr:CYTH domain-containing protein [Candidatus Hydrogenedentota bacterium]HJP35570.1 CYTH domain-containing protein [Gammaproteobacteria bacterium]
MPKGIERKFLVTSNTWRDAPKRLASKQGYLKSDGGVTVRVRIMGDSAKLSVKSGGGSIERDEYEYSISVEDAEKMLANLCEGDIVRKTRHYIEHEGLTWEVDELHGANEGLVVAEVELESSDQEILLPPWGGEEVSYDSRYKNVALSRCPFREW